MIQDLNYVFKQISDKSYGSDKLATIEIVAPAKSSLADLSYWYDRSKEIWPNHEIIVTTTYRGR